MKPFLDALENRFRNAQGIRAAWPPHQHKPYRAELVDVTSYYYNHNAIDSIKPVLGFEVPEGHLFFLDSIVMAGNIFQSPRWWDWMISQVELYVDSVKVAEFMPATSGLTRPDQPAPGAAGNALTEQSPLLYLMNDISDPIIPVVVNNLDAGDDLLIRIRSGHSPTFGLEYEGQGPKKVYRAGQKIEIRYTVKGVNEVAYDGTTMAALYAEWITMIMQFGTGNIAGVPVGPDSNPATDDAGFYNVGAFTPLALAPMALLTDADYATPVGGIPAIAAWVGGESIGVDCGPSTPGGQDAIFLKNKFILFLNQASTEAEVQLVTWQVGASEDNVNWFLLRLDQVRYREIPAANLFWIEFEFTQNNPNVPYWSTLLGWPLSSAAFRYVKVRAAAIAPGVNPGLQVTEASVAFGLYHRIAARMHGWMWQPEFDVISAGGSRIG